MVAKRYRSPASIRRSLRASLEDEEVTTALARFPTWSCLFVFADERRIASNHDSSRSKLICRASMTADPSLEHRHLHQIGRGNWIKREIDGSAAGKADLVAHNLPEDKSPAAGCAGHTQDIGVTAGMKIERPGKR